MPASNRIATDHALRELQSIRHSIQGAFDKVARKRKLRPSERAMTLASLQRKLDALDLAVELVGVKSILNPETPQPSA